MNRIPTPSTDFPADWATEFREELAAKAETRVNFVARVLLGIELALLVFDLIRTQGDAAGADTLMAWRLAFLLFLSLFILLSARVARVENRVRTFLAGGLGFAAAGTLVLAPISGDMAVFVTGALAIAALCPLPGRFNAALFIVATLALSASLPLLGTGQKLSFWLVNVISTCVLAIVIERLCFATALAEFRHRKALVRQRERVDELLYSVFPQTVAAALKEGRRSVAMHSEVTILFADVVGFTALAGKLLPSQLVEHLETLFGRFDRLAASHGVEKIKTIGDAYMAIAGAPDSVDRPVEKIAEFALDIVAECERFGLESGFDLALRVGIHTGPVVAGVIGSSRLCYDLWGDSVNLAQRLEAHGDRNLINVSEPVFHRLRGAFRFEDRGLVDLKGKGPTRAFILCGPIAEPRREGRLDEPANDALATARRTGPALT